MTRPAGPARHAGGMNIYLINALLILLVVRQIREHQLDLRALAVPVLAVAVAAVMFLHSVPGGGSDIALDLLCVSAGAAMGAIGGLATRLRLGADGQDRDGQGSQVELVLADLADDEEDEQRVDQVNVHAASVPRGPGRARHPLDGSPG